MWVGGGTVSRDEWILAGEFAIRTHLRGKQGFFRALEIADVGRARWDAAAGRGVELKAPGPTEMSNAMILVDVLHLIRERVRTPIRVHSWYRDQEYNDSIPGAAKRSMHIVGAAADISSRHVSPAKLFREAEGLDEEIPRFFPKALGRGPWLGLGLYGRFLHIDVRGLLPDPLPGARWGISTRSK